MPEADYFVLLTERGQEAYARAVAGGPKVEFSIFAVGDGNGASVIPSQSWTGLTRECWRGAPGFIEVDPDNPRIVMIEAYLPHNVGGFTIRELGLFDATGTLLAVGNFPESYKPTSESGAGKEMRVRVLIEHTNAERTILKIDPSIVMASREYAEKVAKLEIKAHNEDDAAHGGLIDKFVPKIRTIGTTPPLRGGGDLTQDRTLGIDAAVAGVPHNVILRDSAGRAQVAAPAAAEDIARKAEVDAVSEAAAAAQTTADAATRTAEWAGVSDKPATFAPSAHNHDAGNITSGVLAYTRGGTQRTDGRAVALATARNIALSGAVTGNANFDGSVNISIATTIPSLGNYVLKSQFTQSFGNTGWTKLPNGLLMQWGEIAAATRKAELDLGVITFPVAFPGAAVSAYATVWNPSTPVLLDYFLGVKALSKTQIRIYSGGWESGNYSYGVKWFVIGY